MFDSWESIVALVVAILIAYAVVLWLGTIVWTYRDIRERTRDGWSQAVSVLLVVIFNIPGLFLYLILRPHETLNEAYERRLEAEALMRDLPEPRPACPNCQRTVEQEFLLCPHCRTKLREPCSSCARPLELSWSACPYCAAPGPQAVGTTSASTASGPPTPPTSQPTTRADTSRRTAPTTSPTPQAKPAPQASKAESPSQSIWRRFVG